MFEHGISCHIATDWSFYDYRHSFRHFLFTALLPALPRWSWGRKLGEVGSSCNIPVYVDEEMRLAHFKLHEELIGHGKVEEGSAPFWRHYIIAHLKINIFATASSHYLHACQFLFPYLHEIQVHSFST